MTEQIDFGKLIHEFNEYSIYILNDIHKFLKSVKIWKGLRTKNGKYSVELLAGKYRFKYTKQIDLKSERQEKIQDIVITEDKELENLVLT